MPIGYRQKIAMLGSCFTSGIGSRLQADGFDVMANPMGPLYNPASLARVAGRAVDDYRYTEADLIRKDDRYHILDFPSRYQDSDSGSLIAGVNAEFATLAAGLRDADLWIITFGTAHIFQYGGVTVGNCHKLPASEFTDRYLSVDEIVGMWQPLTAGRRVIFTVSPIRHVADGLHGNQLSKARLLLAVEALCQNGAAEYFPSYEILLDDLRDYRFYAPDMKHPSETAVDYIYGHFAATYFSEETACKASAARKEFLRSQHRNIL